MQGSPLPLKASPNSLASEPFQEHHCLPVPGRFPTLSLRNLPALREPSHQAGRWAQGWNRSCLEAALPTWNAFLPRATCTSHTLLRTCLRQKNTWAREGDLLVGGAHGCQATAVFQGGEEDTEAGSRTISGRSVSAWPGAQRQPARCVLGNARGCGKQERHSVEMGKQVQRLNGF